MPESPVVLKYSRIVQYWLWVLCLTLAFAFSRGVAWQGSVPLHTVMESIATVLAAMVGTLALLRYYTRKNLTILLIGTGFLGTALLDGYHALVTSEYFAQNFPSPNESLIPWSWIASRLYLSFMLFLSWLVWHQRHKFQANNRKAETLVFSISAVLTILSFFFFAFYPLPRAYYPEWFFHRPEEFLPALFFALALGGYLRKGAWQQDMFEHWLVLSLIVSFLSQAMFMSLSGHLFDLDFDLAHLLKKVSYVLVLIGLLYGIYSVYLHEQNANRTIQEQAIQQNLLLSSTAEGIFGLDNEGFCTFCNPAAIKMLGYRSPNELIGRPIHDLIHRSKRDGTALKVDACRIHQALQTGQPTDRQQDWFVRRDGSGFDVEMLLNPMFHGGELQGMVCAFSDITERLESESSRRTLSMAVAHFPASVMVTNAEGSIEYVNPWTEKQSGYSAAELLGQNPRVFQSGETPSETFTDMWAKLHAGQEWNGVFYNRSKQHQLYTEEAWIAPVFDQHKRITHFVSVTQDITQRVLAEQDLKKRAYHDELTGLANRTLFYEHLQHAIEMALHRQESLALIFLDLDNFKPVNDNHGHQVGDELLKIIGQRLESQIRRSDMAARLGGDEFTLLLDAAHEADSIRSLVQVIHAEIQKPIRIEALQIQVTASIGVALFPADAKDLESLVASADRTMYEVKRRGRNGIAYAEEVL